MTLLSWYGWKCGGCGCDVAAQLLWLMGWIRSPRPSLHVAMTAKEEEEIRPCEAKSRGGEVKTDGWRWDLAADVSLDGAEGLCNCLPLSPFAAPLSPAPMTYLPNSCLPDIPLPSSVHFPILFLSHFSSSPFLPIELTHVHSDGVRSRKSWRGGGRLLLCENLVFWDAHSLLEYNDKL